MKGNLTASESGSDGKKQRGKSRKNSRNFWEREREREVRGKRSFPVELAPKIFRARVHVRDRVRKTKRKSLTQEPFRRSRGGGGGRKFLFGG